MFLLRRLRHNTRGECTMSASLAHQRHLWSGLEVRQWKQVHQDIRMNGSSTFSDPTPSSTIPSRKNSPNKLMFILEVTMINSIFVNVFSKVLLEQIITFQDSYIFFNREMAPLYDF